MEEAMCLMRSQEIVRCPHPQQRFRTATNILRLHRGIAGYFRIWECLRRVLLQRIYK